VGWSYRIASWHGIDVKVHATFLVIIALAALNWSPLGLAGVVYGVGLVVLLFGCVTLHEFGHALAARVFHIPVREIVLMPIGGVAVLGRNPRNGFQELVIAAAGPIVNVAIVMLLLPVLWLLGEPLSWAPVLLRPDASAQLSAGEAVRWLVAANIGLVLFNLIPAFPLDGGRILRGLLALRYDWLTATRWSTATSRTLAVAGGIFAAFSGHIFLMIVAVLVYVAAAAAMVEERGHVALSGERVGEACNHHAITVTPAERISTVVRHLLTSYQPDFAVIHGRELLGVVTRADVLVALAQGRGDALVASIMAPCPTVDAALTLAEVRALLDEQGAVVAAVHGPDGYIGLVSRDDLAEAEMILHVARRAPAAA
jgi:Zn-dependent protease/predicted transcriptional regulator